VTSIIEQIQRDALDRDVRVSDLLRRVKFAATKLGMGAVEDWVENELSGYKTAESVPDYRIIHGRPMSRNPYRGWEAIGGSVEGIAVRHVAQSITSVEELTNAPKGATVHFPYLDSLLKKLNDANGTEGWLAALEVDKSTLVPILDRVRTLVLDWALKLEQAGVLGTEYNFDAAEKAKAQGAATTINIGTISSFAGNLGTGNVAGNISLHEINFTLVRDLATQLNSRVDELTKAGADGATLKARLDSLDSELQKPQPTTSVVRGLLVDLRNAVAGAAGNLMATGAIALINQILATGVPMAGPG
jgi:hypothetical protein